MAPQLLDERRSLDDDGVLSPSLTLLFDAGVGGADFEAGLASDCDAPAGAAAGAALGSVASLGAGCAGALANNVAVGWAPCGMSASGCFGEHKGFCVTFGAIGFLLCIEAGCCRMQHQQPSAAVARLAAAAAVAVAAAAAA